MLRSRWTPLALVLSAACASAPPPGPAPLCSVKTAKGVDQKGLGDRVWLGLLLQDYDADTGRFSDPALDCTGALLGAQTLDDACRPQVEKPLPREKVGPDALHFQDLPDGRRLAWAAVEHFQNGDAMGPVAVVEFQEGAAAVRDIGVLRASPRGSAMKLVHAGGGDVLWAEGDICPNGPNDCTRAVWLVPLHETRFVNEPVRGPTGDCWGPAMFPLVKKAELPGPPGWDRLFNLETSIEPQAAQFVIHELLTVKERPRHQAGAPARLVRTIQEDRVLTLKKGALLADQPSLWSKLQDYAKQE